MRRHDVGALAASAVLFLLALIATGSTATAQPSADTPPAKVCPATKPPAVLEYERMYRNWWKNSTPFKITPEMKAALDAWEGCEQQRQRARADQARLDASRPGPPPEVRRVTSAYDPWVDFYPPRIGIPGLARGSCLIFARQLQNGRLRYFVQVDMDKRAFFQMDPTSISVAGLGELPVAGESAGQLIVELSEAQLRQGLGGEGLRLRITTAQSAYYVSYPAAHIRALIAATGRS